MEPFLAIKMHTPAGLTPESRTQKKIIDFSNGMALVFNRSHVFGPLPLAV